MHERAAVDPHHHRAARRRRVGRPHVEVQAVLAGDRRVEVAVAQGIGVERLLACVGAELRRVADPVPRGGWLGRQEAVGAEGRGRERDAAEHDDAVGRDAAQMTRGRVGLGQQLAMAMVFFILLRSGSC